MKVDRICRALSRSAGRYRHKDAEYASLIKSLQEHLADANEKLEGLRGVLKPWPEENIVSYGRRVRDQAAGVFGGKL